MKLVHALFFLSIATTLLSCGSTSKAGSDHSQNDTGTNNVSATTKNKDEQSSMVTAPKVQDEILTGKQDKKALTTEPYSEWFIKNYEEYKINPEIKPMLRPLLEDVTIKAFMGTWCSDSQREVPTFYKILDASDFNYDHLELITVSREKTTPQGYEEGLDIKRVPTFIFYKDGKEIGRYVEFAVTTLEDDMLSILSGGNYKHSYYEDN